MKERIVTLYTCDFCKKRLISKKAMERHETMCVKNPNRNHCPACGSKEHTLNHYMQYQEKMQESYNDDGWLGVWDEWCNCKWCLLFIVIHGIIDQKPYWGSGQEKYLLDMEKVEEWIKESRDLDSFIESERYNV